MKICDVYNIDMDALLFRLMENVYLDLLTKGSGK